MKGCQQTQANTSAPLNIGMACNTSLLAELPSHSAWKVVNTAKSGMLPHEEPENSGLGVLGGSPKTAEGYVETEVFHRPAHESQNNESEVMGKYLGGRPLADCRTSYMEGERVCFQNGRSTEETSADAISYYLCSDAYKTEKARVILRGLTKRFGLAGCTWPEVRTLDVLLTSLVMLAPDGEHDVEQIIKGHDALVDAATEIDTDKSPIATSQQKVNDSVDILANSTTTQQSSRLKKSASYKDLGGRHYAAPGILAHPDEFKNPSSFLKLYGDPQCVGQEKRLPQDRINLRGNCPKAGVKGNWKCSNCLNINFPRRFNCLKCTKKRTSRDDAKVRSYTLQVYEHFKPIYENIAKKKDTNVQVQGLTSSHATTTASQATESMHSIGDVHTEQRYGNSTNKLDPFQHVGRYNPTLMSEKTQRGFIQNPCTSLSLVKTPVSSHGGLNNKSPRLNFLMDGKSECLSDNFGMKSQSFDNVLPSIKNAWGPVDIYCSKEKQNGLNTNDISQEIATFFLPFTNKPMNTGFFSEPSSTAVIPPAAYINWSYQGENEKNNFKRQDQNNDCNHQPPTFNINQFDSLPNKGFLTARKSSSGSSEENAHLRSLDSNAARQLLEELKNFSNDLSAFNFDT